ncbi:MAG: hypothetical protein AAFP90_05050 [Planctomycetota bacterium]
MTKNPHLKHHDATPRRRPGDAADRNGMTVQPSNRQAGAQGRATWQGRVCLLAMVVLLTGIWLWGLPALATFGPMRRWIDFCDQRSIDPSAMFYTDVEDWQQRVDSVDRRLGQPTESSLK